MRYVTIVFIEYLAYNGLPICVLMCLQCVTYVKYLSSNDIVWHHPLLPSDVSEALILVPSVVKIF